MTSTLVLLAELVDHAAHRYRLHQRAGLPEHIQKVHTQQAERLCGGDELAVVVNDSEPVGVAVGRQPDVGGGVFHRVDQRAPDSR